MTRVQVLLFDLGGVLVDYSGVRDLARLLPTSTSSREILDRVSRCPHSEAFGLGRISPIEFAERFVQDWRLEMQPEQFLAEYRSWSRGLLPGARELLAELRPRFRLAALSNSNEAHWDRNTHETDVTAQFEVAVSSHHVGLRKPDPAFYAAALERLQVSRELVLFFDDSQGNVTAAQALGINAFRVEGVEDIRTRLIQEGLL